MGVAPAARGKGGGFVEPDEADLLDYCAVVRKRLAGVAALVGLSTAAALAASLLLPAIYEGRAAILAPKETGGGGQAVAAMLAAPGAGPLLGGILPGAWSNRDVFVSILKSDTMARDAVGRFDLRRYYDTEYESVAIKSLKADTSITVSKEGTIGVTTQHTDPRTAAALANFYVENLDRLFARLGTTDASRQRAFIQDRLERTRADLRAAEEALRRAQESNRAVVLQEQSKVAIEAAARLRGEIAAAEVQLEVLRTFATERHPDVIRLQRRLAEMKHQLGRMQYGAGLDLPDEGGGGRTQKEIVVPAARVPQVGLELARILREVKTQETVFTLLTSQLEQAKIAEARDTPVVQVLDRAVVPDRKAKPRTALNVAIAGLLSAFAGVFGTFFLEYLENARRRRGGDGLPEDGVPALQTEAGDALPVPHPRHLPLANAEGAVEEEYDAVDVRQLELSPLAADQERKAGDGSRGSTDATGSARAKR